MTSYDVASNIYQSLPCGGSYCCNQAAADECASGFCEYASGACSNKSYVGGFCSSSADCFNGKVGWCSLTSSCF
jgi:hypothetical protein